MAESLSQSEVEALLSGLQLEAVAGDEAGEPGAKTSSIAPDANDAIETTAVQAFAEGLSAALAEALRELTGSACSCRVSAVASLPCDSFTKQLAGPAGFITLQCQRSASLLLLELSPGLSFSVVDLLLGGDGSSPGHVPSRPLTEVELKLLDRAADRLVASIEQTNGVQRDLNLNAVQIESRPPLVPLAAPDEPVITAQFDAVLAAVPGQITLSIPVRAVPALIDIDSFLPAEREASTAAHASEEEVIVRLGTLELTVEQLDSLETGDVLSMGQRPDDPATVLIAGRPAFEGTAGIVDGRKAVRITDRLD